MQDQTNTTRLQSETAALDPSTVPPASQKVCNLADSKRILITNINGLIGYSLFESMRNDYKLIESSNN